MIQKKKPHRSKLRPNSEWSKCKKKHQVNSTPNRGIEPRATRFASNVHLMRADNVSHYTNSDWLKEQNLTGPILCGERKHKPPRFIRSNLHNRLGTNKLYIQAHASNIFAINSLGFLLYLLVPNSYRNDQLPIERQYGANRGNLSWKVAQLTTHSKPHTR